MTTVRERLGLPPRIFLYTVDQIADLLRVTPLDLQKKYLWYSGRVVGRPKNDKMIALNIAPEGETPEWRVDELEFIRWVRHKKILILR